MIPPTSQWCRCAWIFQSINGYVSGYRYLINVLADPYMCWISAQKQTSKQYMPNNWERPWYFSNSLKRLQSMPIAQLYSMPSLSPGGVRRVARYLRHSVETCVWRKEKRRNIREENKSVREVFINPSDLLFYLIKNIACLTYRPRDRTVWKVTFIIKSEDSCIFTSCYTTVLFVFTS